VATLSGVSDRERWSVPGFLFRVRVCPRSPDRSVVTAFVMLADIQAGSVQTAPGEGGRARG
jgi:hypothetical protein